MRSDTSLWAFIGYGIMMSALGVFVGRATKQYPNTAVIHITVPNKGHVVMNELPEHCNLFVDGTLDLTGKQWHPPSEER